MTQHERPEDSPLEKWAAGLTAHFLQEDGPMVWNIRQLLKTAWREAAESATEAAAKKCEAVADNLEKLSVAAGQAAQECAAAIRAR